MRGDPNIPSTAAVRREATHRYELGEDYGVISYAAFDAWLTQHDNSVRDPDNRLRELALWNIQYYEEHVKLGGEHRPCEASARAALSKAILEILDGPHRE